MVMENLKHALTVSRISRIMDIPRSTIYYTKTEIRNKEIQDL